MFQSQETRAMQYNSAEMLKAVIYYIIREEYKT